MADKKKTDKIIEAKDVQYYAQTLAAWYNTRLEHDKSLLALSAGGIGLLFTLLSTVGVKSVESLVLYICAIICFIICLITVLWIFLRNASYLEKVVKSNTAYDPILKTLDHIAIFSFGFGVIFAAILGINAATKSFLKEEAKMSDEKKKATEVVKESFSGVQNLRPGEEHIGKSFHGATNLRPSDPKTTPAQGSSSDQGKSDKK